MPVIGFFRSGEARASAPLLAAFRSGLKEAGFVEGQNVAIEYRWTNDHRDRLPALASDLVGRQVAVIVANQEAALAAKTATSTLPIVFVTGADPVRAGLVTSFNRPEGNVTGIVFTAGDLAGKRLGLLRDLVPTAPVIGVLVDPKAPAAEQLLQGVEESRRVLGLRIEIVRPASEANWMLRSRRWCAPALEGYWWAAAHFSSGSNNELSISPLATPCRRVTRHETTPRLVVNELRTEPA